MLLFSAGCSDKKEQKKAIPAKACAAPEEKNCTAGHTQNNAELAAMLESATILKSVKDETHGILVYDNHFIIHDAKQPILLLNFFSTWCPPCRGQIPYFEDLQKKYPKALFIAGILVNDDINATALKRFYETYHIHYFVSNDSENAYVAEKVSEALKLDANFTLPLTVLYRNGKYYTHYEGPVPVEMIDHDIRMALEEKSTPKK